MLVGVVKLAPELPVDHFFPYIHLERSFMHLGFHIYDVGFQSRNSEAGKPMVFVTTLLLISLVAVMNATAVYVRNRLKKRFITGDF
jgi:phosphate transport system permease protein